MILKLLLLISSVFIVWIIFLFTRLKKLETKQRKDFEDIFGYLGDAKPILVLGSSYSWPTFSVIFRNKEELEYAKENRLTNNFENYISKYYGSGFEVKRAVDFTYEGWGKDYMKYLGL